MARAGAYDRAEGAVRDATSGSKLEKAARAGYATKGVLYVLIGVFAFRAAIGSAQAGGEDTDVRGVIREIAQQPFGMGLLVLVAIGLAGYALWRFVEAVRDPEGRGSDAKAIVKRVGYAISGLIYTGLAWLCVSILTGTGSGGSGGGSSDSMTAKLMSAPGGRWLVALVGVIVIGVAVFHFVRAYKASFMERMKTAQMHGRTREWVERAGRVGLSARGVTFLIIGGFFVFAAWRHDPSRARGLSGALDYVATQPYGPWLLGIVGLGLVCYGAYCFANARYRRIRTG